MKRNWRHNADGLEDEKQREPQWRSPEQVRDFERVWGTNGRFGRLDFVTCWYRKAIDYLAGNTEASAAFVSTNSIVQGEQVGILWPDLNGRGAKIHFAHRTFQWSNEARGMAAVHCVIIGFGIGDREPKTIFDYATPKSEAHAIRAKNISPYLVEGPDLVMPSRTEPPPGVPPMKKGSQPTDGGFLILSAREKDELLSSEPSAARWLRPYVGGEELINGGRRWCLWLKQARPEELKALPQVRERVAGVKAARLRSPTGSVRQYAAYPTLFTQDRQPDAQYLAVPEVSSENRRYIPMAFLPPEVVASNKLQIIIGADRCLFGLLSSAMHMAWVRCVAGRLESRYSYAPSVYNNFPWPETLTPGPAGVGTAASLKTRIEAAAQGVLDARAQFPDSSLADLYDPLTMPPALVKAHHALDRAVDAAYGKRDFKSDAERVAFLFTLYQKYTSLLPAEASSGRQGQRAPRTRANSMRVGDL